MTLVRIEAQYRENVAWSEGGTHWKNKGGIEFNLNMPIEWLMYDEERVISIIKDMLAEMSNDCTEYVFVDCSPVFIKPQELSDDEFKRRFQTGGRRERIKIVQ